MLRRWSRSNLSESFYVLESALGTAVSTLSIQIVGSVAEH
jgi:hypothetical protein